MAVRQLSRRNSLEAPPPVEQTPGLTPGCKVAGRPKGEPPRAGQGWAAGGQPSVSTSSSLPSQPPLVLFALAWGARRQPPGQDHALRVVKAPGPGVAPGNELTKSLSCEGPGSGSINMTGLPRSSSAEPGTERLARGEPKVALGTSVFPTTPSSLQALCLSGSKGNLENVNQVSEPCLPLGPGHRLAWRG